MLSKRPLTAPGALMALAVAGAAGCLLAAPSAMSAAEQPACGPASARTIVADAVARVYRVRRVRAGAQGDVSYQYYGCTTGEGTPVMIGFTDAANRIRAVKLVGTLVGAIADQNGVDSATSTLAITDLATGRALHTTQTLTVYLPNGSDENLVTYVLSPSGDIAWATSRSSLGRKPVATIRRVIGHTVNVLDRGTRVRPGTLRLRGHVVQWLHGKGRRRAALP